MSCPACGGATVRFAIPAEHRELAPETVEAAAICTRCLTVEPTADEPPADPAFQRVSEAFPTRPAPAVPLALCLWLCESLATNRRAIEAALEAVERGGADPLLAIDRLIADRSVEPAIDLERRRHQLEDMLY